MADSQQERLARSVAERLGLLEEVLERPAGLSWCVRHTRVLDRLWRGIVSEMEDRFPDAQPLAVVATGGYGREELSPFSDVDISLVPMVEDARTQEAVRWLFRTAQDVIQKGMRVRLGYVYRLVSDVPGLDAVSLSGLLDARLVAGSAEPLRKLREEMWGSFPVAEFLLAKLDERGREMGAWNDTPLAVEPHLKFGAGGLRDCHGVRWLEIALGGRGHGLPASGDAVLAVRNVLHALAGRQMDHLNFDRREQVARVFGEGSWEFGARLAGALESNHRAYEEAREQLRENRYRLGRWTWAQRGEVRFAPGAPAGQAAVGLAYATRLGLAVPTMAVTVGDEAGPEALHSLSHGEETVRNLDRAGILEKLLPELTATRHLMPRDPSHRYTVFEHTLRVLRNLERLRAGLGPEGLAGVCGRLTDWESLVLAALLHDVGKGLEGRPHSETGAEVARDVCERWRLDRTRTETVVWLVGEHLSMSRTIRMRDVFHAETAQEFAALVGSEDRLDALTLLTWADVNAVSGEAWTPVQETFLLELHARAGQILQAQEGETVDEETARRMLRRGLAMDETPEEEVERFLASLPTHYVLSTSAETVREHFALAKRAEEGEVATSFRDFPDLRVTDLTVSCPDQPGRLTRLLGVLYAHDLSLVGLRASTTSTGRPVLIDTFTVGYSGDVVPPRLRARVMRSLADVLTGVTDVDELLREKGKDPERRQERLEVTVVEGDPAIVEFRAPRGRGLAFRLSRVLAESGLNVLAARVGQWAGSGSAAFYVSGLGEGEAEGLRAAFLRKAGDEGVSG